MTSELSKAVDRSTELLSQHKQLVTAIAIVESELPSVIDAKLGAEASLCTAESAHAIGESDGKTAVLALKQLQACRDKLDSLSARLKGLKARSAGMLADMTTARQILEEFLPQYRESIIHSFAARWDAGVTAFSRLLAERQALEGLSGGKLFELRAPSPELADGVTIDTGDLGKPGELIRDLTSVIDTIRGEQQHTIQLARRKPDFNRDAVFQFIKPYHEHKLNSRTTADIVGETLCKWLFENRYLKVVDGLDLNEIRDMGRLIKSA